ncbi:efflux RND transporter periplasmic adaptor subunit [Rhodovarius crocodyli]|uniref:Efflux RND transporter periplasmic adaptor subunit n=1 Tax=Rhodovarius crocodyli TaxID=1979269 RepID=A0A437MDR9_9PROT|nr:efflux RND transporter periplasmic adaptor subunit [Rhodovarius crocodyli]RVT95750.1 efflux RND transporter periplasmic adaptor subunit [Rhodovarius crocodyli]
MKPVIAVAAGAALALGVAVVVPSVPGAIRTVMGLDRQAAPAAAGHGHGAEGEAGEGALRLSEEQIRAARIDIAAAAPGSIVRRVSLPGTVSASADRQARVPARVAGIVTALNRRLGDTVQAGEVLAVIEGGEIATVKGEYLAALRTTELARVTFEREQRLWARRVSAEQDFLKARTDWQEAQIRLDLARQRLAALGLTEAELQELPRQPIEALRRREVRAPIAGRITARPAMLGAAVTAETEIYSVAELSSVWVELAVPTASVEFAAEGTAVRLSGDGALRAEGRIVFLSPVLDPETRSARAVVEVPNPDGALRPGAYVTAELATAELAVDIMVPRAAIQQIGGEDVVFVRTQEGFERREVVLGRSDQEHVEIVFGLDPGERYAASNSFILKAEIGKAEAEHSH